MIPTTVAQNATISVPHVGPPSPATVTVDPGDSVTWTNGGYDKFVEDRLGNRICPRLTSSNPCTLVYPESGVYAYKIVNANWPTDTSRHHWGSVMVTGTPSLSLSVAAPASGAAIQGVVTFSGSAADSNGVARVEYKFGGEPWRTATGTDSWSFDIDTTTRARGAYTVQVRALASDAEEALVSQTVTIDNPEFHDLSITEFSTLNRLIWIDAPECSHGCIPEQGVWTKEFILRVAHDGNEPAAFRVEFQYLERGDWITFETRQFNLPPFTTRGIVATWTDFTHYGEFEVRAVLDTLNQVAETNEGNNEATTTAARGSAALPPTNLLNPV